MIENNNDNLNKNNRNTDIGSKNTGKTDNNTKNTDNQKQIIMIALMGVGAVVIIVVLILCIFLKKSPEEENTTPTEKVQATLSPLPTLEVTKKITVTATPVPVTDIPVSTFTPAPTDAPTPTNTATPTPISTATPTPTGAAVTGIPTGVPEQTSLTAEQCYEILCKYTKEALSIEKEVKEYNVDYDSTTTLINGTDCYRYTLRENVDGKNRNRGDFYISTDGTCCYVQDTNGNFVPLPIG